MTLTVRLDETLDTALTRYCTDTGISKSLAVQESLALYLVSKNLPTAQSATPSKAAPSANFNAFVAAGLVGTINNAGAGPQGATKAVVRARVAARVAARVSARVSASKARRSLPSGRA